MYKEYIFADGYHIICKGMNKLELDHEVAKHGIVIQIKKV